MRTVREIIESHPQTTYGSCVAWATEIVLLANEQTLPNPSLQGIPFTGFGQSESTLRAAGFDCTFDMFDRDFLRLERDSLAAIAKGSVPIVTFPSFLVFNPTTKQMEVMEHAYVLFEENGGLIFGTWIAGKSAPWFISAKDFDVMRHLWTQTIDYIHLPSKYTGPLLSTLFPVSQKKTQKPNQTPQTTPGS